MKHMDPKAYLPLEAGKPVAMSRDIEVRLEKPGTVKAVWDGGETVIGYGTHIRVTLNGAYHVKTDVDGSYYTAPDAVCAPRDEAPMTNESKRPNVSAAMEYVMREVRQMKIANKALQKRMASAKTLTQATEEPSTDDVVVKEEPAEEPQTPQPEPEKEKGKKE